MHLFANFPSLAGSRFRAAERSRDNGRRPTVEEAGRRSVNVAGISTCWKIPISDFLISAISLLFNQLVYTCASVNGVELSARTIIQAKYCVCWGPLQTRNDTNYRIETLCTRDVACDNRPTVHRSYGRQQTVSTELHFLTSVPSLGLVVTAPL